MIWDIKTSTVFQVEADTEPEAYGKAEAALKERYSLRHPGKAEKEWRCETALPELFPGRDRMSLETELIHFHAMIRKAASDRLLLHTTPERMEEAILAQIGTWFDETASDASKAFSVRADRATLTAFKGGKTQ